MGLGQPQQAQRPPLSLTRGKEVLETVRER
jgi:hypothetical protein